MCRRRLLREQIDGLARERQAFLRAKVEEEGGAKDSLDQKIYETVTHQASDAGLEYDDAGPEY